MAVLDETDRADLWRTWMESVSARAEAIAVTKDALRDAVDAIDDWVESNAAAFNTALPQPARSALTAAQKASLLAYVVRRRYERT